jgi:hypothetical protein
MGLGRDLGLVFQNLKTVWPTTQIEFSGLELDLVAMEAHLPPDKLSFLRSLLYEWSVKCVACICLFNEGKGNFKVRILHNNFLTWFGGHGEL